MSKYELITLDGYNDGYDPNTMEWVRIKLEATTRAEARDKGLEVVVAMAKSGQSIPDRVLLVEVIQKDDAAWQAAVDKERDKIQQKQLKEAEDGQRKQYEYLRKKFEGK